MYDGVWGALYDFAAAVRGYICCGAVSGELDRNTVGSPFLGLFEGGGDDGLLEGGAEGLGVATGGFTDGGGDDGLGVATGGFTAGGGAEGLGVATGGFTGAGAGFCPDTGGRGVPGIGFGFTLGLVVGGIGLLEGVGRGRVPGFTDGVGVVPGFSDGEPGRTGTVGDGF